MTRKHFMAIAAILALHPMERGDKLTLAQSLAESFAGFNPQFNRAKFMEAVFPASDAQARRMLHIATK